MQKENNNLEMDFIKEYAIVKEILLSGFLNIASAINQGCEFVQNLYKTNDILGLIKYEAELIESNKIDLAWAKAIAKSSGLRFFLISNLHDVKILTTHYERIDANNFYLIMELSLVNCMHLFNFKKNNNDALKNSIALKNPLVKHDLIEAINACESAFIIGQIIQISKQISITLEIDMCSKGKIEKQFCEIDCDEIILIENC